MLRSRAHGQDNEALLESFLHSYRSKKILPYIPRAARVLDLGCGYRGTLLRSISSRIDTGVGIDLDVEQLNMPANIRLIRGRLGEKDLPFRDNSFNLVNASALLEHLDDPEAVLSEAYRVLGNQGTLLITVPSIFAKPVLEFLSFRMGLISRQEVADHKRYYTKGSLVEALAAVGFRCEVIKCGYFQLGFNLIAIAKK